MFMPQYERLTTGGEKDIVRLSDKLLEYGWRLSQFPVLFYKEEIPWDEFDQSRRSWSFHIHSLDMIDPLLASHSQTDDLKYLSNALRIGLNWVLRHPRNRDDASPMAWYDMAVGLRAYRLGYLYQAADEAGLLDPEQKSMLWGSLMEHCAELANDANIAFHNNHGYFQVAGQLALGRRFADTNPSMAALYAQGAERLRRMLDQQFGPDGVHREHSPDYHRMVADTLLGLVRAGLVESPDLLSRVDGIEEALAWFVTPAGTIANLGDSDSRGMVYSDEGASRKWTTPLMRAVASNGATGSGWPRGLRLFADSGYAIVRQPDPAQPDEIARDSYLAQTAAFHSRTHKHCDDLSFIWHDAGLPLLVDAGRYGYIGKTETGSELWQDGFWYSDPMRVYMESTRAHNTLEFDGLNALRKGVKPYGSALVQACEREGLFCIETRCKQHRSIWHDRLLVFKPGHWLLVFDVFTDNLKQPHDVKQWFHVAPGHTARQVPGGYDVALADGAALAVRSLIGSPTTTEVISGQMEPIIQGWWSEKERSAVPADAFAFSMSGASTGVFATLFSLSAEAVADTGFSRSNVTGRKAQLAWGDARGRHTLEFERGEHFHLAYSNEPPLVEPQPNSMELAADMAAVMRQAAVILEYGVGPATQAALQGQANLVFCVHDDLNEIRQLRPAALKYPEALILHYVEPLPDMLETVQAFALEPWGKSWFLQPDLISIGGASALECLQVAQQKITRSTRVLWRDALLDSELKIDFSRQDVHVEATLGNAVIFKIEPQS